MIKDAILPLKPEPESERASHTLLVPSIKYGRKKVRLNEYARKRIVAIINESYCLGIKEKLNAFCEKTNSSYRKKLLLSTGIDMDTVKGKRDFAILYLYTYYQLSSKDIADKYSRMIVDEKGKSLSRRTIHRVVTRYKMNRSDKVAMELKRKHAKEKKQRSQVPELVKS